MASSYSGIGRVGRFRVDSKRAHARGFSYCYPSHPLLIEDDWPNRDVDADKCEITIYALEGTPDKIDDMNSYGSSMTHSFYGHIVEVDCFRGYLVKDKFPSRNKAVEFAKSIIEPVSYDDLISKGFELLPKGTKVNQR